MSLAARIVAFFAAFIILFSFAKTTFAQGQFSQNTDPGVPNNVHTYTQSSTIEVLSSIICQLSGVDFINPNQPCLGIDRTTGKIGFVTNGGGAVGLVGTLISGTFAIPVHFSDYVSYEQSKFGIAQKSYAQGIGFYGLKPVLNIFTIFRNISYLLFVLIFVIVGVAIMLRVRIDPRTVMTIQNQIPKLIIGLVMITFSYAIAGFLIDLMWVSTYFVINTITPTSQVQNVEHDITLQPLGFVNDLFGDQDNGILGITVGAAGGVGSLVNDILNSPKVTSQLPGSCDPLSCVINFATNVIGTIISAIIGALLGAIAGIIVFFIFLIAILVQLFKLWFALLKCFINIILGVVLAPFWILAGLLPRAPASVGWSGWLRHLVGNLAPFPTVVFLFLIARTIMDQLTIQQTAGQLNFNPPLLGNINGSGATFFGALIAVGFILSAPGIVEQVRKAFGATAGGGLGGAGVGAAAIGAIGGAIGARLYYRDPRTGESHGPGANFIRNTQQYMGQTRAGRFVASPFKAIGNSRVGKQFRRNPDEPTAEQRAQEAEQARRRQANEE